MKPWLVRAPDHLGDGLMARPCINALAKSHPLVVVAPKWGPVLYPFDGIQHCLPGTRPPSELAILLKPSFGAAWRHRHYLNRIGIAFQHRKWLLTEALPVIEEHRIDGFNRIALSLGVKAEPIPRFPSVPTETKYDVVFVVGTASPVTVQYKKFAALAQALPSQMHCLAIGGPGDEKILTQLATHLPNVMGDCTLQEVANHAASAKWMIGLDSGLSHLASAARFDAGHPISTSIIIYGSTDPARTGPRHSSAILPPALSCWPCYSKRCHKFTPCLAHPIENILSHIQ